MEINALTTMRREFFIYHFSEEHGWQYCACFRSKYDAEDFVIAQDEPMEFWKIKEVKYDGRHSFPRNSYSI